MKNRKRKFIGVGEIEANGKHFQEFGWAYSEAQFRKIIWERLKKRSGKMKVYLINFETREITHFNDKEVEMYSKILNTKTK
ncbi:MAG: hypothetical protein HYW34_03700 [Candidatus Brennerbacteria bacterium]|nr:hypothetical protein [Candidatus Brennerbacteria bacterium]